MKMMIVLSAVLLTITLLAACTPSTKRHSYRSIKCPACGYQFETPVSPGK